MQEMKIFLKNECQMHGGYIRRQNFQERKKKEFMKTML